MIDHCPRRLAAVYDVTDAEVWASAEVLVAMVIVSIEQVAAEEWGRQTIWLLVCLPEPPRRAVSRAPHADSAVPLA
eukprot:2790173-Lingulodinium_polyedra.AAC.1